MMEVAGVEFPDIPPLSVHEAIALGVVLALSLLALACCCKRKVARCFACLGCSFCLEALQDKEEISYATSSVGQSDGQDGLSDTETEDEEAVFPFKEDEYDSERAGNLSIAVDDGSTAVDLASPAKSTSFLSYPNNLVEHKADNPCEVDDDPEIGLTDEITWQNTVRNAQLAHASVKPQPPSPPHNTVRLQLKDQQTKGAVSSPTANISSVNEAANSTLFAQEFPIDQSSLNRTTSEQIIAKKTPLKTLSLTSMRPNSSFVRRPLRLGNRIRLTPAEMAKQYECVITELRWNLSWCGEYEGEAPTSSLEPMIEVENVDDEESVISNDDGGVLAPEIEGRIESAIERKLTQRSLLEVETSDITERSEDNVSDLDLCGVELEEIEDSDYDPVGSDWDLEPEVEYHIGGLIERKLTQQSLLASHATEDIEESCSDGRMHASDEDDEDEESVILVEDLESGANRAVDECDSDICAEYKSDTSSEAG